MDITKETMAEYKIGTDFILDEKHYTITNWCKYYKAKIFNKCWQFDICLTLKNEEGQILLYAFNLDNDVKFCLPL